MRLVNSQFIIIWHRSDYIIRSTKHNMTVAIGFYTWVDALVFLMEDTKVILSVPGSPADCKRIKRVVPACGM